MEQDEIRQRLLTIKAAMTLVQVLAEQISDQVLAIEAAGLELPATHETAVILAQVALGWQLPELVG
jgi:hypothetical protein